MKKSLVLFAILFASIQIIAQDFSQWRGPNRDGKYPDTNLLKQWPSDGPELLWHFDELGEGHGSVAVTERFLYTSGTLDGITYVFALNHQGELQWKSEVGKGWMENFPGVRTTPLVKDGKLYLMTGFGQIVCMDAENGEHKWKVDIMKDYDGRNNNWGVTENLLIDGEKIFCVVGGQNANIIALNKDDGSLIWKSKGNGGKNAYNSPTIIEYAGMKMLITITEMSIIGMNASNGDILWSHEKVNEWAVHPNTPLVKDGMIYCTSGYGSGGVMLKLSDDGKSVQEVWNNKSLDNHFGGVILFEGKIYGTAYTKKALICLDWNTGEEIYSTKKIMGGSVIFADDMIYSYDMRGTINLVKPDGENTQVISTFRVPYGAAQHWAHPVINDQKLYVRHGNSIMTYSIAK